MVLGSGNGEGEQKIMEPTLSQTLYFAPDGTSWTLTKATFSFEEDLHLGKQLEKIILEGVNALSIESSGDITVGHSLIDLSAHPLPILQMDGLPTVMILTIQILPPKAFEWAKETWVVMEEAKDQGKDFRVERSRLVVHQAEGAHTEVKEAQAVQVQEESPMVKQTSMF